MSEQMDRIRAKVAEMGAREFRNRMADLVFGTDEELADECANMPIEEVERELAEAGIDLTPHMDRIEKRLVELRAEFRTTAP